MGLKSEMIKKAVIRTGVILIAAIILLCVAELKKEKIATDIYMRTIYRATAQGRWYQYGQYEPDTLYLRTIDKIPMLYYLRRATWEKEETETKEEAADEETVRPENTGKQEGNLLVRYAYGNIRPVEEVETEEKKSVTEALKPVKSLQSIVSVIKEQYNWKDAGDKERFLKNYYIADVSVGDISTVIDGEKLLSMDTSIKRISEEPQILIYHTHGTEKYADSRDGVEADTVVGMGDILCEELTVRGFSVIHDRTTYDYINGKNNRDYAYTTARPQIEALLEEYPSIEVILDIHRDSGAARRTVIEGKDTAQIMLFNGLCRNASGPIKNLPNQYLDATMAFSLQLNLLGRERFPGLMYKIYLKNYRYNMHFSGHCMLVELGTEKNTVEEARNGVRYLAELLFGLLTENIEN